LFARTTTAATYTLQSYTKAASAITYTFSVYVKKSVGSHIVLLMQGNTGQNASVTYNLDAVSVSRAVAVAGSFTGASSTITPVGNGWFRCTLTATSDTHTSISCYLTVNSNNVVLDGADSVSNSAAFFWGAQLTASSTAQPYLKTVATAVTTAYAAPLEAPNGLAFPLLATQSPARNSDMTVELTNNTTLTLRVRGTDGTVRAVALTLV